MAEADLAVFFERVLPLLDERQQRLVGAAAVDLFGRGGQRRVAEASGLARNTLIAGAKELAGGAGPSDRVRRPGGGRKRKIDLDPDLLVLLDEMVDEESRGDPMSPLRWTAKSTRELARALTDAGHDASSTLVRELLGMLGFSLQAPSKTVEGNQHPDRDGQFRYLNGQATEHLDADQPVISVDTKKSTWAGRSRGSDEMLAGPAGRGRRLLIGASEPARSLAQGPSGPGIVAVSTHRRLV